MKLKFSLIHNNEQISTLDDLREHCDLDQLLIEYQDGRLVKWLNQIPITDKHLLIDAIDQIPNQIEKINENSVSFELKIIQKLIRILDIDQQKLADYQKIKDFQKVYNSGNNYYESQEYEQALVFYNQALEIIPNQSEEAIKCQEIIKDKIAEITRTEEERKRKNRLKEDLGKGIILEMVEIPAGSFMMGGNQNDDEKPIHKVTIKNSFLMSKYPVTQAQYRAIMGDNPSHFKGENNPVERVSWEMAQEFCQKLSQKTGKTYKLPTEAQWEYACRAGSTTEYYFGDDKNKLGEYAWYNENSNSQTHPVGEKKPNNWGLYDMHGNVWEWCEDNWQDNYQNHPADGSALKNNSDLFILRGGSWNNIYNRCRCAFRYRYERAYSNYNYGFRVIGVSPRTTI
jgi:formylglycine-generating enzyme required for sulfatase activity/uncharacterized protein YkvS